MVVQNHQMQTLCYYKVLNISCHVLTIELKVKPEWLYDYRTIVSGLFNVVIPWVSRSCGLLPLSSSTREDLLPYGVPGKRSKFKIQHVVFTE